MRAVILFATHLLMLVAFSLGTLASTAYAQDDEQPAATAEPVDEPPDHPDDPGPSEQTKAIRASWARIFAPPDAHRWEFGLGAGWLLAETGYGDTESAPYLRAEGRRLFAEYLSASLAVDFWQKEPTAGPVEFKNRHVGLTGAVGAHHWFGRWLLGAEAQGGAQWISRTISDASGVRAYASRIDPTLGAAARAGVSIFGSVSLALEGGLRWRPQRLDRVVLFQLGWLTGWEK